jgi:bacteriorhodopsin
MDLNTLVNAAASNWFWTVIGTIAIISIIFGSVKSMVKSSHRERTRREIAAYIAEGSMSPEQGERLMNAKSGDRCC